MVLAKPGGIADQAHAFPAQGHPLFRRPRRAWTSVIGTVGSGKSSPLAALASDMRKTGGSGTPRGDSAPSARSTRGSEAPRRSEENIVFRRDFNAPWRKVVDACALRPDLEMLPAGDATEIGERGITISGGQKQRLSIAAPSTSTPTSSCSTTRCRLSARTSGGTSRTTPYLRPARASAHPGDAPAARHQPLRPHRVDGRRPHPRRRLVRQPHGQGHRLPEAAGDDGRRRYDEDTEKG